MVCSPIKSPIVRSSVLFILALTMLFISTLRGQDQYRVGDIKVSGARILSEDEIKNTLGLASGTVFDEARVRKGFEDLKKIYSDRGYQNFTPLPVLNFDEQRKVVDITINIEENG
jgi:outer membrane protein assembly factor BamA